MVKKEVLVNLVAWDEVMLGRKKVRHNAGYLTGPGGRRGPVESAMKAAVREVKEELGVTILPQDLRYCGVLEVGAPLSEEGQLYTDDPVLERHVIVYTVSLWTGQPRGSDEIENPEWFRVGNLPLDAMRPSDAIWLPRVLNGEVLRVFLRHMRSGELDVALVTPMSTGANSA